MTIKDGGSAFPSVSETQGADYGTGKQYFGERGMTLRDYFAAKVMQARLINKGEHTHGSLEKMKACVAETARLSYEMADAMIAEREKGNQ
jgi:hypothetical protein